MRLSGHGRVGRLPAVATCAFLLLAGGAGIDLLRKHTKAARGRLGDLMDQ